MKRRHPPSLSPTGGTSRNRAVSRFSALAFVLATALLVAFAAPITSPAARSPEKDKKEATLHWDPPQVDAPIPSLSAMPPCWLHGVLKLAGQRATELVDHLQNFNAHEQVRFEQTDTLGMSQLFVTENFEYLVDFGEQSGPLKINEIRKPLGGSDDARIKALVDKGLPALGLIFYPVLQGDYEMHCEGATQWNGKPAWVVYFRQANGIPPRTLSMSTATMTYPVSLKGRAWIATDSGQLMHLETNLVKGIPIIDLRANAVSVDYAPVEFKSRNIEIWLPQSAIAFTDYGKRRTIIEHTFSDFLLFSVQTRQVIGQPKEQ